MSSEEESARLEEVLKMHSVEASCPAPSGPWTSSTGPKMGYSNVVGGSKSWQKFGDEANAASEYRQKPPSHYKCHRCGAVGEHFIQQCPTNVDENYVRRREARGIPKQLLREISEEELAGLEATDQVFKGDDEKLYILIRKTEEEIVERMGGETPDMRIARFFGLGPNALDRRRYHTEVNRAKEEFKLARRRQANPRKRDMIKLREVRKPVDHWAVQRMHLTCDIRLAGAAEERLTDRLDIKEELTAIINNEKNVNESKLASRTHLLNNPLMTPCCGRTFCKKCLEQHLSDCMRKEGRGGAHQCPACRERLDMEDCIPDVDMRELIDLVLQGRKRMEIVQEEARKLREKIAIRKMAGSQQVRSAKRQTMRLDLLPSTVSRGVTLAKERAGKEENRRKEEQLAEKRKIEEKERMKRFRPNSVQPTSAGERCFASFLGEEESLTEEEFKLWQRSQRSIQRVYGLWEDVKRRAQIELEGNQ